MFSRSINGLSPWLDLGGTFDRMLGDVLGSRRWPASAWTPVAFPAMNVVEAANEFRVEAELAGMRIEDLEITVIGNELTLKGERKAPELGEATWHRRERAHGEFQRQVRLPVDVDAENVQAKLHDGVLTVVLPKAPEARPRRIEVTTSY
jgi:HSP20 family protein